MILILAAMAFACSAEDAVEVKSEKDATFFVVRSTTGIGKIDIPRPGKTWPKSALRMRLNGLEHLAISNGKIKIEAAVAFRDGKPHVRVWKDGKENEPLDEKSPHWLVVRVLDAEGKATRELPLKGGHFEIVLPESLLDGETKSLHLSWIDFYR